MLTLRVVSSTFIFGSLMLPSFLAQTGIILGSFVFLFFFCIYILQSDIMLELKRQAKLKIHVPLSGKIFLALGPTSLLTFFRIVFIANHSLYLILCFTIFGTAIQQFIALFMSTDPYPYLSRRLYVLIGGLIVTPFIYKERFSIYFVCAARALGFLSIMMIAIGALVTNPHLHTEYIWLPSQSSSFRSVFASMPAVILAFAYHFAFFNTQFSLDDPSIQIGHMLGSILILFLEVAMASIGQVAFYSEFPAFNDNLLYLLSKSDWIPVGLLATFLLFLSFSALVQVLQYIPQSVKQIQNIRFGKPTVSTPPQFRLILDKQVSGRSSDRAQSPGIFFQASIGSQLPESSQQSPRKAENSGKDRRVSWVALIHTALVVILAAFLPPIVLPIFLMGTLTQNTLTLFLPSFLYLKWQQEKGGFAGWKCILGGITLCFSLLFGFTCLICGVLELNEYFE